MLHSSDQCIGSRGQVRPAWSLKQGFSEPQVLL